MKVPKVGTYKVIAVFLACIVIAILAVFFLQQKHGAGDAKVMTAINKLEHRQSTPPALRLEEGLVPPTNKWFSGIVFGKTPQPVYAYPLSLQPLTDGSLSVSYPTISPKKDTIFAEHTPDVRLILGSTGVKVSHYDDLTFTMNYYGADDKKIAETTAIQGSPYVFTKLGVDKKIAIASTGTIRKISNETFQVSMGNKIYGIYAKHATVQGTELEIAGKTGDVMTIFAVANADAFDRIAQYAANVVTAGIVNYSVQGSKLSTTYTLKTIHDDTVFAAPLSDAFVQPNALQNASYHSIYGALRPMTGTQWKTGQSIPTIQNELPVGKLSVAEKTAIIAQLKKDIVGLQLNKPDTYFGGKELYRTAQLLRLAKQLGLESESRELQNALRERFDTWLNFGGNQTEESLRFYYDSTLKGVVGLQASFGSEVFNDHHFHYGYFLNAAAVLATYDKGFVDQHGAMITALADDIANPKASSLLPKYRVFDQYTGHSWASGFGDFADGNNQESSSEAVSAWLGVHAWAEASHDDTLKQAGTILYTRESAAASEFWLKDIRKDYPGYEHSFVALRWGGKLDAATFFSNRPQALLGIQLIPMNAGQQYFEKASIKTQLTEVAPTDEDFYGQFGDYLTMYLAVVDRQRATNIALNLPDTAIDDANSRSYVLAWIYTQ